MELLGLKSAISEKKTIHYDLRLGNGFQDAKPKHNQRRGKLDQLESSNIKASEHQGSGKAGGEEASARPSTRDCRLEPGKETVIH